MMITAFSLCVAACFIPKWSVLTQNGNQLELGIWEICLNGNCTAWSTENNDYVCYGWVAATAAFNVISICALAIGVVFSVLLLLCIKLVPQVIAGCMFYFGIWAVIACVVTWALWAGFANQDFDSCGFLTANEKIQNYDISFALQVAASVLAGIASCLACCTCCVGGSGWKKGDKDKDDNDDDVAGPYGTDYELDRVKVDDHFDAQ